MVSPTQTFLIAVHVALMIFHLQRRRFVRIQLKPIASVLPVQRDMQKKKSGKQSIGFWRKTNVDSN